MNRTRATTGSTAAGDADRGPAIGCSTGRPFCGVMPVAVAPMRWSRTISSGRPRRSVSHRRDGSPYGCHRSWLQCRTQASSPRVTRVEPTAPRDARLACSRGRGRRDSDPLSDVLEGFPVPDALRPHHEVDHRPVGSGVRAVPPLLTAAGLEQRQVRHRCVRVVVRLRAPLARPAGCSDTWPYGGSRTVRAVANPIAALLFGRGRLSDAVHAELESEGIIHREDGLRGSITYRHYRAPGQRSNWSKEAIRASFVVTRQRLGVFVRGRPFVNVAFDDPRFSRLDLRVDGASLTIDVDDASVSTTAPPARSPRRCAAPTLRRLWPRSAPSTHAGATHAADLTLPPSCRSGAPRPPLPGRFDPGPGPV
jgi:hypothetical protein